MRHSEQTEEVFSTDYTFSNGALVIGDKPGLGVDIDEAKASKYPYKPR